MQNGGVVAFALPRNLVECARENPLLGAWVAGLPDTVREVAVRWSLRLDEPYQPGGQCSWVAPARDAGGQERVLKVGWRHDEAAHEAEGLRAWGGRGAVFLHDAYVDGLTSALLLERCTPGTPLGLSMPEPEQDLVVATLLHRLWMPPPPENGPFRPLQVMCERWAAEFEEEFTKADERIDPGLAHAGMALFRELPQTAQRCVLLCTDLHAENILAAQREPWLVIDPKPYVGDPAYDVLQHMLNCDGRLAADPGGLARRMAHLLGLDGGRVSQWLFARCVQESINQPWLRDIATALAPA